MSSEPCRLPRSIASRRQLGFTLLELLVALSIFALIAVIAYNGLYAVLNARAETDRQAERLAEIQTALAILGRDIEQTLNREIRDEFGDRQPALRGDPEAEDRPFLEFTRAGWRNPARQVRSHLQRVGYRMDQEGLVRVTWRVLDRAQDSAPVEEQILSEVTAVQMRFLDDRQQWHTQWPPPDMLNQPAEPGQQPQPLPLPRAVELALNLQDFGRIVRLFALPPG